MRRGFTMIEVMVAGAILAIGCLGVLAMLLTTIDFNRQAHLRTQAITLAEQQLAIVEAASQNSNNWDLSTNIVNKLKSKAGTGGWLTDINIVNVNGAKPANNPTSGTNDAKVPAKQFAVGYYVLAAGTYNADTFIRGAIRVIWNKNAASDCLDLDSLSHEDALGSSNYEAQCDFVSLPFALKRPSTTTTF